MSTGDVWSVVAIAMATMCGKLSATSYKHWHQCKAQVCIHVNVSSGTGSWLYVLLDWGGGLAMATLSA
jgi:hypothetical protein